jgi:hypothetical protein
MMLCGIGGVFNSFGDGVGSISGQCRSENRQVVVGLQPAEALGRLQHDSGSPAQRISTFCQRFTLRQTRRTVSIMFSIALVQASERRSDAGNRGGISSTLSRAPREAPQQQAQ